MPDWKDEIRQQLVGLNLPPMREAAIIEELAQFLEDCYEDWLARGATPAAAYQQALTQLSESELLARELRRVERRETPEPLHLGMNRRSNMMADLGQDLRFGARLLRKHPGFTFVAVLTLALGIGANTAILSLFDALLWRPLAVKQPERLAAVYTTSGSGSGFRSLSYSDYLYYRDHQRSFTDLAAWARVPERSGQILSDLTNCWRKVPVVNPEENNKL